MKLKFHFSVTLAIFQVLNSLVQLIAIVLDSIDTEHFHHHGSSRGERCSRVFG